MLVTKKCYLNGRTYTMEIPLLTPEKLRLIEYRDQNIQEIAPELSADEREFLMTGITATLWDETFKDVE